MVADYLSTTDNSSIDLKKLLTTVNDLTAETQKGITDMKKTADAVSIADMMELQMRMNRLSQATEMAASVSSALNSSIQGVASKIAR